MKRFCLLIVAVLAFFGGCCPAEQIASTVTDVNKDNVVLTINCDVQLPTGASIGPGFDYLDGLALSKGENGITKVYLYAMNGIYDVEKTPEEVNPYDATSAFEITKINSDKRSGKIVVTVVNKALIAQEGRYFKVVCSNTKLNKTVVTTDYILWNKPIKLGDKIVCNAVADGIYAGIGVDININD